MERTQTILFTLVVTGLLFAGFSFLNGQSKEFSVMNEDERDTIFVPIVLHRITNSGAVSTMRDNENIITLFKKTQKIWDQADIKFDVTIEETILPENLQRAVSQEDYRELYSILSSSESIFHIFFVRTLYGTNGIALSPSVAFVADITTVNDFRATAHEIGHLLGLSHTPQSTSRLLFRGANGTELTVSEIGAARKYVSLLEGM